jgi:hypothetical protein
MKRTRPITIIDAINDKNLFAPWFKDRATWEAWFAFLAALFALPMSDEQRAIYRSCTSRTEPPTARATEAWLICGRRAGKSFILALCAVFLAAFCEWRRYLQAGELGTVMVIASDRKQARTILRYIRGLLTGVPMLAKMILRETAESFDLANSVVIEVATASFRSVRGYTIVAALADEIAFWPSDDSATPDFEIINALKPAMATIPGSVLLAASSPYARKGSLFNAHRRHFGKDGPVLVWKADTRRMNATVPQSLIDEAMEADPARAAAEYMAEFRSDLSSYIDRDALEAVVSYGVFERAPISGVEYFAAVDPSGGVKDSFALAIAHRENDTAILDCVREIRAPFNPESAVEELSELVISYRCSAVVGDRYAGEWPREQFRKRDIEYKVAEKPTSDLFRDMLPAINSRQVDFVEHERLFNQLLNLERRTARSGKDSIAHPPGSHDDIAAAVAGAVALANVRSTYNSLDFSWVDGDGPDANEQFRQRIYERLYGSPYRRLRP